MQRRPTNISAQTLDVFRFCFEVAAALELDNEHSGLAVRSALYICFAELGHARLVRWLNCCEVHHEHTNRFYV